MLDGLSPATADAGAAQPQVSAPAADQVAQSAPAPQSQPAAPWFAAPAYTDDDRAYLENKGWNKPETPVAPVVLKSYRELERVMGAKANAVILPRSDDPAAVHEFMVKLGKPAEPGKYAEPVGLNEEQKRNLDPELMKTYSKLAYASDMTQAQHDRFLTAYEGVLSEQAKSAEAAFNGEVAQTKSKFQTEFGDQYGEQIARGNLAMQRLGISRDDMAAMSEALGVERASRMMMKLGGEFAQHKTVGMDGNSGGESFVTDKARASAQISRINRGDDPNFKKALLDPMHPDHKNVTAQWKSWQAAAFAK